MSLEHSNVQARGATVLSEESAGVYAALFNKINLSPVAELAGIDIFQNSDALSEVSADERVTAAVSVFLKLLKQSPQKIERLDKSCWMSILLRWTGRLAVNSMRSCTIRTSSASSQPGAV